MVFRFTLISDETDNFLREIKIDSDATFYDLHKAILSSVGYKDDQMTSFFICDDDWDKRIEITLEDMSTSSDEDTWVMDKTKLSELIEDEQQKLLYMFDQLNERSFAIELSEIITGHDLTKAVCSKKQGNPPTQIKEFDDKVLLNTSTSGDLGETFYGDQEFDPEDFDADGFDISDGDNASINPDAY